MSKNKNKLRRTLALTASVAIMGTSIPFNVLAEGAMPTPTNVAGVTRNANQEEWQKEDFVIDGTTVMRFSDKGKEKVKTNKNLVIPDGVTKIYASAFEENQLTSVTIPDSVTEINWGAFQRNQLTNVTIPNSVTEIMDSAFAYNQLTSVTIPDSITEIRDYAFENNQLTSVTIPDSVTTIGSSAFKNNKLTEVTIPDSVTEIGDSAFKKNQLTSVTIPNSVTSIETNAFYDNQLTSVTIPDSVTEIMDNAFAYNQLTSVTIPNSVTSIGSNAFENNQLTSVTIPDSVTSIGGNVFAAQKIKFCPKQNPFELKDAGINLMGLKENISDISPFVRSYYELNKEKEKLSFPKDIKRIDLNIETLPEYQYSAVIEIHNPGKYVTGIGTITPAPTINKDDIEKEIVPWGKAVDLTDNIKDLPEGATVEDITDPAIDTKKPGNYTGKAKVTFKDGSSRVVDIPVEVEKSMADTFVPEVTEEEVTKGNEADITDNINNLPDGATVKDVTDPKVDTDKVGKTTGKVEITFPDGSTKEVDIPVKVIEDKANICEDTEPLKKKIKDLEKELQEEKDKNKDLEDKIKNQEDKNKDLDNKIKDLEDKKKDLEDKLDQEKAKTEQNQNKIKELENKIADLEKQIGDLKKEKGKLEKELEDLKGKLGDKDKEIKDKDKQIEELKKLLEEAKKKAEEKPVVEDKKPSKEDTKPNTTNNNINIDLGRNDFEREYYRRNHRRLPFEIVYEREVPRYTSPAYTGYNNYKENRLEYIFTIGSTVYQRIMGANTENRSMDVAPYIKNDRTMLPLRYVAEAIGAEVRWDNTTRTAYFTKDGVTAKIQIDGNKIEMSDGRIFEMDSKPDNIKGRIFVSLTNISKVFNLTNGNTEDGINQQIEWNRHNKQVSISLNR